MRLKEAYILANCCSPRDKDRIVGYYSHDNFIKVHRFDCANLSNVESTRLVQLSWQDIITENEFVPDSDFDDLDEVDFAIMRHHQHFGVDYSLVVADILGLDKQAVFEHHRKLRDMGLLARVKPVMMQYRKNIVKNKWIKHRNHTYYELTEKGRDYLAHKSGLKS